MDKKREELLARITQAKEQFEQAQQLALAAQAEWLKAQGALEYHDSLEQEKKK